MTARDIDHEKNEELEFLKEDHDVLMMKKLKEEKKPPLTGIKKLPEKKEKEVEDEYKVPW